MLDEFDGMDQPEFRVWDKIEKKMSEVCLLHIGFGSSAFSYPQDGEECSVGTEDSNRIIMQYTGFKDANGDKIYFDDIVTLEYIDDDESYCGEARIVRTMNNGVGIHVDWEDEKSEKEVFAVTEGGVIYDIWPDVDVWQLMIIGNVYENPELIKNL